MNAIVHLIANLLNYILLAALIVTPLRWIRRDFPWWRFWLTSGISLMVAVIVTETGKALPIWAGHTGFPSGHETFALAALTALTWYDRRWLWPSVALALLMGWSLVAAHYHDVLDVAGALLVGPPCTLLCFWTYSPSPRPKSPV